MMPLGGAPPIASPNTSTSWPLTTKKADDRPRCVSGMPALRRRRDDAGHAGDDVERDARPLQRLRFFAAAAEHERVAALEPHHLPAASGRADHQRVDLLLRQRVAAGALADEEPLRAPRQREHALVDERVVEHQIGAPQPRHRLARQQRRIAGPAPTSETWPITLMVPVTINRGARSARRATVGSAVVRVLCVGSVIDPVQAPRSSSGRRASIGTPSRRHSTRSSRATSIHVARSLRQHGVERFAQQPGQPRRVAARRNRQRHAVAPDHAAQDTPWRSADRRRH